MPLSIKDAETDRLARELAGVTGESLTTAVANALRERLERVRAASRSDTRQAELTVIADRAAALPVLGDRSEADLLGYGADGLPA
ncbi:type II toxin-antitoxin system VapB family antitoxin [Jannaschia sp. R86511]|uniref:type II toxin-antitoxin system VapB family antitoxin n=1 Tax=Jannaschia sp. R86511 TaxID=3093853 RepID=UPI0036D24909